MYTDKQLEEFSQRVLDIYEPIISEYIELMGTHIKNIGELTKTDVHRLEQIQVMKGNASEIAKKLSLASNQTEKEIEIILQAVADDYYSFSEKYYTAQGLKQVPILKNTALMNVVKAEIKTTSETLINLAKTTANQLKTNPLGYVDVVDKAIRTVSLGLSDYNSAIRSSLQNATLKGIEYIDFESGYRKSLDSQIRMNVMDGIRTTYNEVSRETGEQYGADAVEISAHNLCALDHLDIQGKKFKIEDWEERKKNLARQLGTLNCSHKEFATLFNLEPTHTQEELDEIAKTSTEMITIDGRTKMRVDWDKEKRNIETAIRKRKRSANAFKASGDDKGRRHEQYYINKYNTKYNKISNAIDTKPNKERMSVSGFRAVKAEK